MKLQNLCFAGILAVPGTSYSDPRVLYRTKDEDTTISFVGIQIKRVSKDKTQAYVTGGVRLKSKSQNLEIAADHATTMFVGVSGKSKLKSLVAEKNVSIREQGEARTSTLTSSRLVYTENSAGANADCTGGVTLTDSNGADRTIILGTGQRGRAEFSRGVQAKSSALVRAVLLGSVVIHVDQQPLEGKGPGKLLIHCDKLTYSPSKNRSTLVIEGNLQLDGTNGAVSGSVRNLQRLTIHLNAKREATDFSTGAKA